MAGKAPARTLVGRSIKPEGRERGVWERLVYPFCTFGSLH